MLEAVNIFLRRESENAEKRKLEGRGVEAEAKGQRSEHPHQARYDTRSRPNHSGQFSRNADRFMPYRHEANAVVTNRSNPKLPTADRWKYLRDPNQYCDFHKKMGHSTDTCEGLKKDKAKGRHGEAKDKGDQARRSQV